MTLLLLHAALAAEPADTAASEPAAQPAWTNDSWHRMYLESQLPDQRLAFSESLLFGFGAGHFYAHDRVGGFIFAGADLLTVLSVGVAVAAADVNCDFSCGSKAIPALGGATLLVSSRIVDALTAPTAARRYAARQIEGEGAR